MTPYRYCPTCRAPRPVDTLVGTRVNGKTIPDRHFCAKCGTYLSPPEAA